MANRDDIKQRIHQGDVLIGVSAPVAASKGQLEDILGKDDYAFVSTDSQHSAFNEETLVRFCAYADELDMPVQFRIKHTYHSYLIGNVLDLGPAGIEVPQVEEEATVEEALKYFYYPQQGKRSWGGVARWKIEGNDDRLAYADWWNTHGWLCLQMESIQAVSNARHLAKPGVDCLTWGPNDLRYDIEAHPQHPCSVLSTLACNMPSSNSKAAPRASPSAATIPPCATNISTWASRSLWKAPSRNHQP